MQLHPSLETRSKPQPESGVPIPDEIESSRLIVRSVPAGEIPRGEPGEHPLNQLTVNHVVCTRRVACPVHYRAPPQGTSITKSETKQSASQSFLSERN